MKLKHAAAHHLAKVKPWHGVVVLVALVAVFGMVSLAIGGYRVPTHQFSPQRTVGGPGARARAPGI